MIYENTSRLFFSKDFPFACSYFEHSADNVEYHCHKELEILCLRSGSITILYNQKVYHLTAGDIFIIAPYYLHALTQPSGDYSAKAFVFDLSITANTCTQYDFERSFKTLFQSLKPCSNLWEPSVRDEMFCLLEKMYEEYTAKNTAWKIALQELCTHFLLLSIRNIPSDETVFNDSKLSSIQVVIEYISENMQKKITEADCAKLLNLHPSSFSRYFKKNVGFTFQEYLKRHRIEHAKFLLQSTHMPITDICYETGFTDISTFNKHFKSLVQMNPTQYRKHSANGVSPRRTYGRSELTRLTL